VVYPGPGPFLPILLHDNDPYSKVAMGLFRRVSKARLCRVILMTWITVLMPLTGSADEAPVKTVRVSGDFVHPFGVGVSTLIVGMLL
jgi:hypothetical protein